MSALIGDLQIRGRLSPDKFDPPTKCITNASVDDDAGIDSAKVIQQRYMEHRQAHGTAVAAKRETMHQCRGVSGKLVELFVSLIVACTSTAKVQVMIKKNGVDMLAAALEITSATAAFASVSTSTFVSTDYTRDDCFEAVITPVAGGGVVGQGLLVTLVGREYAE